MDVSNATAPTAQNMLKIQTASISYNCQKKVDKNLPLIRGTKIIQKVRKKARVLEVINEPIIHKFSNDFPNCKKKSSRAIVLAVDLFLVLFNAGNTNKTFQQSKKIRAILKHNEEFS